MAAYPHLGGDDVTEVASSLQETPVFIPHGSEEQFAVVTEPTGDSNGIALVITSSGHWTTTVGTNRTFVRLARRLAGLGFTTVRFDYLGVGESSGGGRAYQLEELFTADVDAVVDWLRARGIRRFAFMGACYGARLAMDAAARTEGVVGVALAPAIVRDYEHGQRAESLPLSELARRALRVRTLRALRVPEQRRRYRRMAARRLRRYLTRGAGAGSGEFAWVSPLFLRPFERALDRGVRVLFVFGRDEDFYGDFCRGREGPLGRVLERGGDLVQILECDGSTHGLNTVAVQEDVIDAVTRFLASTSAS